MGLHRPALFGAEVQKANLGRYSTNDAPECHYLQRLENAWPMGNSSSIYFLLLPMVDPLFGHAFHRRAKEKILLVCPFSAKQDRWFDLECVNVYDGKKYKMVDCKEIDEISNNVVFPSQFGRLLIEYQEHPEAKSLAPDGSPCKADTKGLLQRAHIVAGEIRFIGKETDRKWEEGDEISILESRTTEYGRSGKVVASEEIKNKITEIGINKCARESGFDRKNFIRKLIRGIPVKRNSYNEFERWLRAPNQQNQPVILNE